MQATLLVYYLFAEHKNTIIFSNIFNAASVLLFYKILVVFHFQSSKALAQIEQTEQRVVKKTRQVNVFFLLLSYRIFYCLFPLLLIDFYVLLFMAYVLFFP